MRLYTSVFTFITFLALVVSCSPKLHPEAELEKVERRKTDVLVAALDTMSQLRPTYFYSKIKCAYSDTNQNKSFKTSIRMVKDSAVNALITFATIPIINSIVRPDSVIITNRQDKCVIRRDLDFIKEQFGVSFDYRNIEELLLGLPIGFDTTQKYFQIHDPHNYILSSHKKREIRRETRNKPERDRNGRLIRREDRDNRNGEEEGEDVILKYYLTNDLRTLKSIFIDSPDDTTNIQIDYLTRDSIDHYLVPNEVQMVIVTPRNRLVITLDYERTEVNVPQEIRFVIPEEYGECSETEANKPEEEEPE
ncbi:MAG: hypothetical protein A3D31_14710 [Candidatus Fluviicola riflensis]|nr:MAG: hypothetical protein A3D31_14710 [Candidatus Fluviicola riflensis]OGS85282.1 MAG: hypothetical protein A2724_11645 [Fluviicola sp. RIFCSPHIGHO2_01_FULL_43_53]OGS87324.1 MAG: hypothetical protein A3E30_08065 [Fluviicola sp. RIFCSPHIGHO2_12_FULL_43_24]